MYALKKNSYNQFVVDFGMLFFWYNQNKTAHSFLVISLSHTYLEQFKTLKILNIL